MLQIRLIFINNQTESAIYLLSLIYSLVSKIFFFFLLSEDSVFSEFLFFSHKSIQLTIFSLIVLQQTKQNDSQT